MTRRRPYPRDPYWMTARYAGRCTCGATIQPENRIYWYPNTRTALCATCGAKGAADLADEIETSRRYHEAADTVTYNPRIHDDVNPGMEAEAEEYDRMERTWAADTEQAALEAAGNRAAHRLRAAEAAYLAGDKDKAASLCPHGWGYSHLKSDACDDPMRGADGARCFECGSRLTELRSGATVIVPCETAGNWGRATA